MTSKEEYRHRSFGCLAPAALAIGGSRHTGYANAWRVACLLFLNTKRRIFIPKEKETNPEIRL